MKVRIGLARVISWFDANSVAINPALLTGKIFLVNTLVSKVTWVRNVEIPNLFLTEAVTFKARADDTFDKNYTLKVYYDAVLVDTLNVTVDKYVSPLNDGAQYLADLATATVTTVKVAKNILGANQTVSLKIIRADGSSSASLPATYVQSTDTYDVAGRTFVDEGPYFLVWYKVIDNEVTPAHVDDLLALIYVDEETTVLRVKDADGDSVVSATAVVSTPAGTQVAQGVTGTDGGVTFQLLPGHYVLSLLKTGVVFTRNNFKFEVVSTTLEDWDNRQYVEAPVFTPTVSAPAEALSLCTLFATVYRMTGTPLAHADVQVGLVGSPSMFTVGVFDTRRVYKTDSNGYVEFILAQGITVEVLVTPIGLRRIIKVPNSVGPINLLTLLSDSDDVFDIVKPNIPTAPKRNL